MPLHNTRALVVFYYVILFTKRFIYVLLIVVHGILPSRVKNR